MKLKLKPLKTTINGYLTIFRNFIINENFNEIQDWLDSVRDYLIYRWIYKPTNEVFYYGKGKLKDGKFEGSRPFMHSTDMLKNTINPNEWYCEILFYGLTEKQAYAGEAYLISICSKERSHKGQYVWDGRSLINKRREWKHEKLIEKYLKLDGNNDWETLRREIDGY